MNQQDSELDKLFEDNFYQWLEYNGTDLEAQHTSGRWRAMVDLNKLKASIEAHYSNKLQLAVLRGKREELSAAGDSLRSFGVKELIDNRIAELDKQIKEIEDEQE